jgi:hypothetical protein
MVGSKGGPGGVNQTRPLLTTGGIQAILGVQVLQKCLDELQNLENIDPNQMAPKARKKLGQVCKDMAAGLSGVELGTGKLLRCSGMQYAAKQSVRETPYARWQLQSALRMPDGSCNLLSALEACAECDDSQSRLSGNQSSEGESAIVGQDCPRLHPFKVGDVAIPMPENGLLYQNKEAVRVLRQVREEGAMLSMLSAPCGRGTSSTSPTKL